MSRRREPRVEMNVEVKVWGLDRNGKPFVQHARTVDANHLGARLVGVDCVKVGEVIGIQNGESKGRFKVIWIGRDNTPKAGQIGVHCVEPEKEVFSAADATPAAVANFSRAVGPQSGFAQPRKPRPLRSDMPATRRRHPRYPCAGGVELRQNENGSPTWGNLSDISMTGCYVETASTLAVGSMVLFQIQTHDLKMRGRAMVKASHHTVGMGLAFLHLNPEDQQNLEFLIGTLAGMQEMRPEDKRTFVPADAPPAAPQPAPAAISSEMTLQPLDEQGIGGQIMRAIAGLNELEQTLVKDQIEPRLIAQFHDGMEHTRQTAWTVQQWLDLRNSDGDPFEVLPQLEAERMHMLIKLAHNVLADIDSGSTQELGEGVEQLYETIQQLHKRLQKIFLDLPEGEDEEDGTARFKAGR